VETFGEKVEIIIIPTNPSKLEKELLESVGGKEWCVIHEFNQPGLYAAWNEGFSIAKGEIMGAWNVDDIRFAKAVIEASKLVASGADLVYFPFYIKRYLSFGPFSLPVFFRKIQGEVLKFEKRKFQINMTTGPHFMFTREAYKKVGPFDEQFKIAGDFDWCARAVQKDLNFVLGKEFSGVFRVDGRGLSSGASARQIQENNIVYQRQRALEKIKIGDPSLEGAYDPKFIFFKNEKIGLTI
jgi:glycosyltransferase involved in cell wall biosynthesis